MAEDLADACASSIGGIVTVAVTYPIEIVKNKVASASSSTGGAGAGGHDGAAGGGAEGSPPSALDVARGILRTRGAFGFYDGVTVSAVENVVEKFLYFYAYSFLRRRLQALSGGPSLLVDLLAGSLAEIAHLPASVPLETVLIKVVNSPEEGALATVRAAVRDGGIASLYAGCAASAVLSIKPALQLACFEAAKSRLLLRRGGAPGGVQATALSAGQAFVLGALARAVATVVVFPYIRAKFMLKHGGAGEELTNDDKPRGIIASLHAAMWLVVERQGLAGLYRGLLQELARATMSAALLMAIRERLFLVLHKALSA